MEYLLVMLSRHPKGHYWMCKICIITDESADGVESFHQLTFQLVRWCCFAISLCNSWVRWTLCYVNQTKCYSVDFWNSTIVPILYPTFLFDEPYIRIIFSQISFHVQRDNASLSDSMFLLQASYLHQAMSLRSLHSIQSRLQEVSCFDAFQDPQAADAG